MKIRYPGLICETLPSGHKRYRVRVEGDKARRVTLLVNPGDPDFSEAYAAARYGIQYKPEYRKDTDNSAIRGSIAWLAGKHLADLERKAKAGHVSSLTVKKRTGLMTKLCATYGPYSLAMPTAKVIELRDSMAETPAMADSMVEAIRAMYRWAIDTGIASHNPAIGVGRIDKGKGGAIPWTPADLRQFRERHPKGTQAHLCITLLMFTACRIGDAISLGRGHETVIQGVPALVWQPAKKGSALVQIPMMPQLHDATRAVKVIGPGPYLRKADGQPYQTADQLGQRFRKWCDQAGLEGRSAHGIRKAAGHLLAIEGCTQYQIMAIHGHTNAKTSEVYTKGVERWALAKEAMAKIAGIDW